MARIAILGASGSVGAFLLPNIFSWSAKSSATLINRRKLSFPSEPWAGQVTQQVLTFPKFTDTDPGASLMLFHDQVCSALLGSNAALVTFGIGKASTIPSLEEFEYTEKSVPVEFAKAAKQAGVRHMGVMTAAGADSEANTDSMLAKLLGNSAGGPRYNRVKGEIEQEIKSIGFESVSFFRPGGLIGSKNTPFWVEPVMGLINNLIPAKIRNVRVEDVGLAIAYDTALALEGDCRKGIRVFEGESLFQLIKEAKDWQQQQQQQQQQQGDMDSSTTI